MFALQSIDLPEMLRTNVRVCDGRGRCNVDIQYRPSDMKLIHRILVLG